MNMVAEYEERCREPSDIHLWLPTLYQWATKYSETLVLELGVRSGNSTAAFLAAQQKVGGHVWSVDIVPPQVPPAWHQHNGWSFLLGDDRVPPAALPGVFDVVFIDTSHSYEHTTTELQLYVPRVLAGGVVLLHDTEVQTPDGVGGDPPFPVARALDDYCAAHDLHWHNLLGCNGLGVLPIDDEVAA